MPEKTTRQIKKEAKPKAEQTDNSVAVIIIGSEQFLVKQGSKIVAQKIINDAPKKVEFTDLLNNKKVLVAFEKIVKGKKIKILKFKNKTNYMKRLGHRQQYLVGVVEKII